jgi:hypothetical protein
MENFYSIACTYCVNKFKKMLLSIFTKWIFVSSKTKGIVLVTQILNLLAPQTQVWIKRNVREGPWVSIEIDPSRSVSMLIQDIYR